MSITIPGVWEVNAAFGQLWAKEAPPLSPAELTSQLQMWTDVAGLPPELAVYVRLPGPLLYPWQGQILVREQVAALGGDPREVVVTALSGAHAVAQFTSTEAAAVVRAAARVHRWGSATVGFVFSLHVIHTPGLFLGVAKDDIPGDWSARKDVPRGLVDDVVSSAFARRWKAGHEKTRLGYATPFQSGKAYLRR